MHKPRQIVAIRHTSASTSTKVSCRRNTTNLWGSVDCSAHLGHELNVHSLHSERASQDFCHLLVF